MFYLRFSSLCAATIMFCTVAHGAPVTLKSTNNGVELTGELKSFENGVYVLESDLGALEVDARTVTCEGIDCPKDVSLASTFTISGNAQELNELLLPLLEGYSFSLGGEVSTEAGNNGTKKIIVSNKDGASFAEISTTPGNQTADLTIQSGSADDLFKASDAGRVVPLSSDAFVIAVSPNNPLRTISQNSLRSVLSGKITNWKDIGGPDIDINFYVPDAALGLDTLSKATGFDFEQAANAIKIADLPEIERAVANDPFGLAALNFNSLKSARALSVSGPCGAVINPSSFTIAAGHYPASYFHYVSVSAEELPVFADELVTYTSGTQAKSLIDRLGYTSVSVHESAIGQQGDRIIHSVLGTTDNVPQKDLREMITLLNGARQLSTVLRFKGGSIDLDEPSQASLDALVTELFLGNYADQKLMFVGFTENSGDFEENKRNSKAAAQLTFGGLRSAVGGEILDNLIVEVHGFGQASPLVCGTSPAESNLNNRVEIWVKDRS